MNACFADIMLHPTQRRPFFPWRYSGAAQARIKIGDKLRERNIRAGGVAPVLCKFSFRRRRLVCIS